MDIMKCCKYCKYFDKESCTNKNTFGVYESFLSDWIKTAAESGLIQETLSEALQEEHCYSDFFCDIKNAAIKRGLRNNKTNLGKFDTDLKEVYEMFVRDCVVHLDEILCEALGNYEESPYDNNYIVDPDSMYCCYYE